MCCNSALPLLALFGLADHASECPLLGVERKCPRRVRKSLFDPQLTFGWHLLSSGKFMRGRVQAPFHPQLKLVVSFDLAQWPLLVLLEPSGHEPA